MESYFHLSGNYVLSSISNILGVIVGFLLLDTKWYSERYPDVAMLPMDASLHYERYGKYLGRAPNNEIYHKKREFNKLVCGSNVFCSVVVELTGDVSFFHKLIDFIIHNGPSVNGEELEFLFFYCNSSKHIKKELELICVLFPTVKIRFFPRQTAEYFSVIKSLSSRFVFFIDDIREINNKELSSFLNFVSVKDFVNKIVVPKITSEVKNKVHSDKIFLINRDYLFESLALTDECHINPSLNWFLKLFSKIPSFRRFQLYNRPVADVGKKNLYSRNEIKVLVPDTVVHSNESRIVKLSSQDILGESISCDVLIVTTLRFPGGNASSTIDEVLYYKNIGLNVKLIHCPVDGGEGKKISSKFMVVKDCILQSYNIDRIYSKLLIVRHPRVLTSRVFSYLNSKLSCLSSVVVVNNSIYRTNGDHVYDLSTLLKCSSYIKSVKPVVIHPLGPAISQELSDKFETIKLPDRVVYSSKFWNPTFDINSYTFNPKTKIEDPVVIGKHGRDGAEKWLENASSLLEAYPQSDKYTVQILGGADNAIKIIGYLPSNWSVYSFGALNVPDFLHGLDVFVYYPNSSLNEAFGRTIMESIFCGVPCILPHRFRETFGDMVFYATPENVHNVVSKLKLNDKMRLKYLEFVYNYVVKIFSSDALLERFNDAIGVVSEVKNDDVFILPQDLSDYRDWVESSVKVSLLERDDVCFDNMLHEKLVVSSSSFRSFPKKGNRHNIKSKGLVYCAFSVPGFSVKREDAQRDAVQRIAQLGLNEASLKDKTVLDLGCNNGAMLLQASNFKISGGLGVEYDLEKVELANNLTQHAGIDNLKFIQGDLDRLKPEELGTFDVVFALAIERHVKDVSQLFKLLGLVTKEVLCFEGNSRCDVDYVKKNLAAVGFSRFDYKGFCQDDVVAANNRRPVLLAYK